MFGSGVGERGNFGFLKRCSTLGAVLARIGHGESVGGGKGRGDFGIWQWQGTSAEERGEARKVTESHECGCPALQGEALLFRFFRVG